MIFGLYTKKDLENEKLLSYKEGYVNAVSVANKEIFELKTALIIKDLDRQGLEYELFTENKKEIRRLEYLYLKLHRKPKKQKKMLKRIEKLTLRNIELSL